GIRDRNVTGVQTCALPILGCALRDRFRPRGRTFREMRVLFAVPALIALVVAAAQAAPASPPTVSCDSAAMFGEQSKPSDGDRVFFDRVAVPKAYLPQVVRVSGDWPYGAKPACSSGRAPGAS